MEEAMSDKVPVSLKIEAVLQRPGRATGSPLPG